MDSDGDGVGDLKGIIISGGRILIGNGKREAVEENMRLAPYEALVIKKQMPCRNEG